MSGEQKISACRLQDNILVDSKVLYNGCLKMDMDAWNYVYRIVYGTVNKYTSPWHLADADARKDMVQDIVCHLLDKGLDQVREPEKFTGYIRRVTVNRLFDRFRKRCLRTVSIDICNDDDRPGIEPACPRPGPEALAGTRRLLESISLSIFSLSEMCSKTLKGYVAYKQGDYRDYATLAGQFQVSVGTFSSRVNRCLAELRQVPEIKNWLEA